MDSPRITPFLWFDSRAEQAAQFYTSIFPNSRIKEVTRYDAAGSKASGMPVGAAMTVAFELGAQPFTALNGGPAFKFTEAVSFVVNCETQAEINHYWDKLSADGGQPGQCGWLKDPFGLSWQVVPASLSRLLSGDTAKAQRVMQALLRMTKLDLPTLERA
jgi:predicted 3-demethylubiquinone-9 3-methyltransferase (glyoxalase superfamily)